MSWCEAVQKIDAKGCMRRQNYPAIPWKLLHFFRFTVRAIPCMRTILSGSTWKPYLMTNWPSRRTLSLANLRFEIFNLSPSTDTRLVICSMCAVCSSMFFKRLLHCRDTPSQTVGLRPVSPSFSGRSKTRLLIKKASLWNGKWQHEKQKSSLLHSYASRFCQYPEKRSQVVKMTPLASSSNISLIFGSGKRSVLICLLRMRYSTRNWCIPLL